jgi:hypothetical protein
MRLSQKIITHRHSFANLDDTLKMNIKIISTMPLLIKYNF